ncbi:MAG: RDD family protein [Chitinophagaceae bacterium]|nr:RDD family protein [Chitinophagaceae bacterium]
MEYPSLLKRVQATFVDQIIAFILIMLFFVIANNINEDSIPLKIVAFFLGISYEPIMILRSRTIGQRLTVTNVEWVTENFPFRILSSYIRLTAKILLGWISLISVSINKHKRAIHDIVAGTVVVIC